jgi:hypothetical protein
MKPNFTLKIARDIAGKSWGYTLDCIMGYGDMGYAANTDVDEFEQNFIEDLEEKDFVVTDNRVDVIKKEYCKIRDKFIAYVRKKYYDK